MSTVELQAKAPPELRNVALFLRSKAGPRARSGVLNGQRRDYFKGQSAIKALLSLHYAKKKGLPKVTNEKEANDLLQSMIPFAFFLRAERQEASSGGKKAPKLLSITPQQQFGPQDYFVWFTEGSQVTTYLGGLAMVAVIFGGVMYPLWPLKLRIGAWYLSIGLLGLLGLFFVIAIVRLIFYVLTYLTVSPGIWIFPNLFADVGFVDSFIPLWEWDLPKKKSKKKKGSKSGKTDGSGRTSAATGMNSALPGMVPPTTPSFARPQQAYIEEIQDDDEKST